MINWFCKHKWKTHNKVIYTRAVSEVLICEKCSKIKIINY